MDRRLRGFIRGDRIEVNYPDPSNESCDACAALPGGGCCGGCARWWAGSVTRVSTSIDSDDEEDVDVLSVSFDNGDKDELREKAQAAFMRAPEGTEERTVTLRFHVYFARLLFEMIADDAITTLMKRLRPCAAVLEPVPPPRQPRMYASAASARSQSDPSFGFSLAGLMKSCENEGYAPRTAQPAGFRAGIELFGFQLSSLQWMVDVERSERGLNGCFWQEHSWADGPASDAFYYFPLAGEFRMTKPPKVTGGLLSEEMGLGKTIISLACILQNAPPPRGLPRWAPPNKTQTRATLIVVPVSLFGQWRNEVIKNLRPGALKLTAYFR